MPQDDYFEDAPGQEDSMPKGDGAGDGADQSEGGQTFLVNKEAYPDAKPGDVFKMRVEEVHDQEMSCSVMKDDEGKEGEEQPPEEAPMPAMAGGGNPMMD
jgi:hypothetical protein